MPVLESIGTAVPEHAMRQDVVRDFAVDVVRDREPHLASVVGLFDNTRITTRHFAKPIEWYQEPHGWEERTRAFTNVGLRLVEDAARAALDEADATPGDVDGIIFVTTTGIATPSLDARLANAIGLRADVLRVPVWGLGCGGGVAGLARAADLARAHPGKRFLLVALELCSLQFMLERLDKRMVVAMSLFSDGCAAALVAGDDAPGASPDAPRLGASASHLFHDTERVMGWDVRDNGLDVVISPRIPDIVAREMAPLVNAFLKREADGARPHRWLFHPGGAKVVDAYVDALGVPRGAFAHTHHVLDGYGNMSSPTVLFVTAESLRASALAEGERALLGALGPGFASEMQLLEGRRAEGGGRKAADTGGV